MLAREIELLISSKLASLNISSPSPLSIGSRETFDWIYGAETRGGGAVGGASSGSGVAPWDTRSVDCGLRSGSFGLSSGSGGGVGGDEGGWQGGDDGG